MENQSSKIIEYLSRWRLTWQSWFGLLVLGLVLWLTITYAELLLEITSVLFGALLLTLAMRPPADVLARRWRIPRGVTVVAIYAGLGGLFILLGNLLVPVISVEIAHLQNSGPTLLQNLLAGSNALPMLKQWLPSNSFLAENLSQRLDLFLSTLMGAITGVGGLALDLLLVLVLGYFFATDAKLEERLLDGWIPGRYRPGARLIFKRLRHRLTRWIWAQLGVALYFAVVFSTGLAILHVPFAFTIGLVGGVLEIIPYLGGLIASLLAIASALTVHPWLALWVALFYVVVIEIESHVIAPTFYGRVIDLHPAVILIALLIGAKVRGILGAFFAIPIAVILAAILQEVRTGALFSGSTDNAE